MRLVEVGGYIGIDDYGWKMDHNPLNTPNAAIDFFLENFAPFIDVLEKSGQVYARVKSDFTNVKKV